MNSTRRWRERLAGAARRARSAAQPADERWWRDPALAAAVGALAVLLVSVAPSSRTDLDVWAYLLVLLGALALVARRRAPVPVLIVTVTSMFGYQVLGYPGIGAGLPVLVALCTAVQAGHRRLAVVVTGLALVKGTAATIMMSSSDEPVREVLESRLLLAGWLIASGVMGEVFRKKQAYLEQVEQRAIDAERNREEIALRRAGEERLRIARELHDSLTHSISVVKVQAGVAVHLARKRGHEVPDALLAIQEVSNDAVRELRATLDVLRSDDDDGGGGRNSLDRLPDLVARAHLAGVPATVTVGGARRSLPRDVDSAAYRIIQEALTNVTRHAGPAEARIRLDYQAEELTVQVDDNGKGASAAAPVPGVGLRGMRERVAALGGHLVAEPRPGGGFTVRAELPFEPRGRVEEMA